MLLELIIMYKKSLSIFLFILVLILSNIYLYKTKQSALSSLSTSVINNKAHDQDNSGDTSNLRRVYQLTIDELNYSKDSINKALVEAKKASKIKDKNIVSLQLYIDKFSKKDTLKIRDTIFAKGVDIDTTLKDDFRTLNVILKYPNKVAVTSSFVNKKTIVAFNKRETVKPPSKYFFIRWFQAKQNVLTVDVEDNNPYCDKKDKIKRFVQVTRE